jgi:post-segregation antitoxin (ccd killing protein)
MRMARINIYVPDELARAAKEAGLNVSRLTQAALSDALAATDTDRWLESVPRSPSTHISHADAIAALDAARDELGSADG